jgi:serine-type D-Ala-D-Ala carboxypeptidase (penicillin-binding protein 5/6)
MNIVQPSVYQLRPQVKQKQRAWWLVVPIVLVLGLGYNYVRPLPTATATLSISGLSASQKPTLDWPSVGQAAIGAPGYDVITTHGTQSPLATASITKAILALCVLDKQPIDAGEAGKTYTIKADDVANYNAYVAGNGSVAAVTEGEKLTEYQALEALMLPSANNIADSLAKWEFGGNAGYAAYAANFLAKHDINHTSTASDLTKIGLLALKSPVLMEIAGKRHTTLPVAGLVNNYNTVLGVNGITGLKTGNNDTNLGALLFTADLKVGDQIVKGAGAVMDAKDLQSALDSATQLAASMRRGFEQVTIAKAGANMGTMRTAWGASQPIITSGAVQIVRWQDTALRETHSIKATLESGQVGSLQVSAPGASAKTNLLLQHDIPGPSFWWRLTRH